MFTKKELAPIRDTGDPFALLRRMTAEFDRVFDDPFYPSFRVPVFHGFSPEGETWLPKVDVFEKENRLVTRVDLPGVKKEEVGERKFEKEEKKDNVYCTEREYGSFRRAVPLPKGVKLEDVKATFADGVLEVSVPLPVRAEASVRKVEIQEPVKAAKTAA
jgi:HSP20 family protein